MRQISSISITVLVALVLAACGSEGGGGGGGSQPPQGGQQAPGQVIKPIASAKGKSITVGSKNFDEQFLLGEIYSQALEAAGFEVKKELNLGSEQIAFKALKGGDVDAYPEYTGTALTNFFDVKPADIPKDPDQAYEQAKKEYAKEGITALPRTKFDNTYVLASTKKKAQEYGNVKTISELTPKVKGARLAGFPECRQRADCLVGLKETYGLDTKFISNDGKYEPIDNDQADLGLVFATDGEQLQADKYAFYEDDKGLFPPYNISLTMSNDALKTIGPEGQKVIEQVQAPLDDRTMQELNSRVSIDKQEPEEVATAYLKAAGFVK
jgi:glycine betaine/choline ABC-type transport system substrate-binding protein